MKIAPGARCRAAAAAGQAARGASAASRATAHYHLVPLAVAGAGVREKPLSPAARGESRTLRRRPRPPPHAGDAGCWRAVVRGTGHPARAAWPPRRRSAGPRRRPTRRRAAGAAAPGAGSRAESRPRPRPVHALHAAAPPAPRSGRPRSVPPVQAAARRVRRCRCVPPAVRSTPRAASRRRAVRHRAGENRWRESAPAPRRKHHRAECRRAPAPGSVRSS